MSKKLIIAPTPMSLEAFMALGPERGRPLTELGSNFAEDVEALERDYGPQVPAFLCRKGRPRKGAEPSPVQPRVVKMPPAFWTVMSRLAEERGLTLHGAMREALLQWTRDAIHPKAG